MNQAETENCLPNLPQMQSTPRRSSYEYSMAFQSNNQSPPYQSPPNQKNVPVVHSAKQSTQPTSPNPPLGHPSSLDFISAIESDMIVDPDVDHDIILQDLPLDSDLLQLTPHPPPFQPHPHQSHHTSHQGQGHAIPPQNINNAHSNSPSRSHSQSHSSSHLPHQRVDPMGMTPLVHLNSQHHHAQVNQQSISSPNPNPTPNPALEFAIYDLYSEMKTMLDKMGNLMNTYITTQKYPQHQHHLSPHVFNHSDHSPNTTIYLSNSQQPQQALNQSTTQSHKSHKSQTSEHAPQPEQNVQSSPVAISTPTLSAQVEQINSLNAIDSFQFKNQLNWQIGNKVDQKLAPQTTTFPPQHPQHQANSDLNFHKFQLSDPQQQQGNLNRHPDHPIYLTTTQNQSQLSLQPMNQLSSKKAPSPSDSSNPTQPAQNNNGVDLAQRDCLNRALHEAHVEHCYNLCQGLPTVITSHESHHDDNLSVLDIENLAHNVKLANLAKQYKIDHRIDGDHHSTNQLSQNVSNVNCVDGGGGGGGGDTASQSGPQAGIGSVPEIRHSLSSNDAMESPTPVQNAIGNQTNNASMKSMPAFPSNTSQLIPSPSQSSYDSLKTPPLGQTQRTATLTNTHDQNDEFFLQLNRAQSIDPPQLATDYGINKGENVYISPPLVQVESPNSSSCSILPPQQHQLPQLSTIQSPSVSISDTQPGSDEFGNHNNSSHPSSQFHPQSTQSLNSPLASLSSQTNQSTSPSVQTSQPASARSHLNSHLQPSQPYIHPPQYPTSINPTINSTLIELEFSNQEPVLASLRLCNPHPTAQTTPATVHTLVSNQPSRPHASSLSTDSRSNLNSLTQHSHNTTSLSQHLSSQPSQQSQTTQTAQIISTPIHPNPLISTPAQPLPPPPASVPPSPAHLATNLASNTVAAAAAAIEADVSITNPAIHNTIDQQNIDVASQLRTSVDSNSNLASSPPQQSTAQNTDSTQPQPSATTHALQNQPSDLKLQKSYTLLPKNPWNRIRIGVDVGGTLAKICYFAPYHPLPSERLLKQRFDQYLIHQHPTIQSHQIIHFLPPNAPNVPPSSTPMQQSGQIGADFQNSQPLSTPPLHVQSSSSSQTAQHPSLSARRAQELEIRSDVLHGTLHFVKFQTNNIHHFFDLVNLEGLGKVDVFATGGGAHKYREDFLNMIGTTEASTSSNPGGIDGPNAHNSHPNSTTPLHLSETQPTPISQPDNGDQNQHVQNSSAASQTAQSPTRTPLRSKPSTPSHLFEVVDEMGALVRGVAFLIKHSPTAECFSFKRYLFHQELEMYTRPPPSFPFLLVNIGSGVSILRVDNEKEYFRVGGSSLGGGTFLGLCRALTGCTSFQDALSLAHRGKGSKVDLLVNDIYGRDYSSLGLSGDTIAASFGKLVKMIDHNGTNLNNYQNPQSIGQNGSNVYQTAQNGQFGQNQRQNVGYGQPHQFPTHHPSPQQFGEFGQSSSPTNPTDQQQQQQQQQQQPHQHHQNYNNFHPPYQFHNSFNPYDYGVTREDLAKSVLVMITNNICSLAHLYARQVLKIPSVVFVGNFLRNNVLAMRMLSYALAYWSNNTIEAIFLKHEGYFGAIGSILPEPQQQTVHPQNHPFVNSIPLQTHPQPQNFRPMDTTQPIPVPNSNTLNVQKQ